MVNITVDFKNTSGVIKDMNAVNNGPVGSGVRNIKGNFASFKALEIPYARTHDSAFCESYGGEHTIDVHRIFKNFDADENDPQSYLFEPSDKYIASIIEAGTQPFFRLGASIEHGHKVGTYPPKDFAKWARICEHIIMHYNEGWADGFHYDIKYWEIWNEPECTNADGSHPCWQGTKEEFYDFYEIAAKHLKACFPNLKIGGPAFSGNWPFDYRLDFLKAAVERKIPMDFYSYHIYLKKPEKMFIQAELLFERFKEYGYSVDEVFVDEWNYVRGWRGEDFDYSKSTIKGLKGSSLVAGTFAAGQASKLDKLMYYEARPCGFCGLYDTDTLKPLKTYYTFMLFNKLKKLGTYVKTDYVTDSIYTCAATDGENGGIMLTNYSEHDLSLAKEVTINLKNIIGEKGARINFYKLDEGCDGELICSEPYEEEEDTITLKLELFTTYYIEITPNK